MKKIIILGLIIGLPIMIYMLTINKKIYYVALGDSLAAGQNPYGKIGYGYSDKIANYISSKDKLDFYTKDFAVSGYRTTDLINDINDNKTVIINGEKISIKHALTKADLITLSIGANDLFYKLGIGNSLDISYIDKNSLKRYVDEIIDDMEKLVTIIKRYCKEDIILVGYYNPLWNMKRTYAEELDPIFIYANSKMKSLSKKYGLYYADIFDVFAKNKDYIPNPLDIHPSEEGYRAISNTISDIINKKTLNWVLSKRNKYFYLPK